LSGRAVAFGRSLGSLYAIELARRQPTIAGLILGSRIADPIERFLAYADLSDADFTEAEVVAAAHEQFHHQRQLAGYRNPLLVLHAEHDRLIEISHAERNYRWAANAQKRLVRFPVGDHNSILERNQDAY
jgi:pimeloyl-ACP methyl ester carboxylesterase